MLCSCCSSLVKSEELLIFRARSLVDLLRKIVAFLGQQNSKLYLLLKSLASAYNNCSRGVRWSTNLTFLISSACGRPIYSGLILPASLRKDITSFLASCLVNLQTIGFGPSLVALQVETMCAMSRSFIDTFAPILLKIFTQRLLVCTAFSSALSCGTPSNLTLNE